MTCIEEIWLFESETIFIEIFGENSRDTYKGFDGVNIFLDMWEKKIKRICVLRYTYSIDRFLP